MFAMTAIAGRPRYRHVVAAALGATAVAACAPTMQIPKVESELVKQEAAAQRELFVRAYVRDFRRLHRIALPIRRANVEICGDQTGFDAGVVLANNQAMGAEFAPAFERVVGIGAAVAAAIVVADGPAAAAGLREGDRIVSIERTTFGAGKDALKNADATLERALESGRLIEFVVARGADTTKITVEPVAACSFTAGLAAQSEPNATADGEDVALTTGLFRFAESDDEIALVLSHEVAHNVMGHIDKMRSRAGLGLIFDILAAGFGVNTGGAFLRLAAQHNSPAFEAEADYVGAYMAARAGYRVADAATMWRRMSVEFPKAIVTRLTHPTNPERLLLLDRTVAELAAKQAAGEPLVPTRAAPRQAAAPKRAPTTATAAATAPTAAAIDRSKWTRPANAGAVEAYLAQSPDSVLRRLRWLILGRRTPHGALVDVNGIRGVRVLASPPGEVHVEIAYDWQHQTSVRTVNTQDTDTFAGDWDGERFRLARIL